MVGRNRGLLVGGSLMSSEQLAICEYLMERSDRWLPVRVCSLEMGSFFRTHSLSMCPLDGDMYLSEIGLK